MSDGDGGRSRSDSLEIAHGLKRRCDIFVEKSFFLCLKGPQTNTADFFFPLIVKNKKNDWILVGACPGCVARGILFAEATSFDLDGTERTQEGSDCAERNSTQLQHFTIARGVPKLVFFAQRYAKTVGESSRWKELKKKKKKSHSCLAEA